ncbi:MAG TPA: diaminobutyrate acetyltransferase [Candidatus Avipropionibacterium avicola]|uniref:L-2,4-diaminobutyric acid acetyltransferase n=1 Tax=Candidatus Avipropionibacterium avicola TaxID=2840701 RepID=A0A9D1GVA6_9ACTN|nr:diaminobutyrate acetyltransferase [Candidatus Avipropionibacterium avicola]
MTSTRQTTLPTEDIRTQITFRPPALTDGAAMWRVARDSARLDLNSPYAYTLWARDFADTTVVAEVDGEVVGFVTGYRRPTEPETVMVWQVAVDDNFRGHGIARRMLDELVARTGTTTVETTITDDNQASQALFTSFSDHHGADHEVTPLFTSVHFPADAPAEPELLHRISGISAQPVY